LIQIVLNFQQTTMERKVLAPTAYCFNTYFLNIQH